MTRYEAVCGAEAAVVEVRGKGQAFSVHMDGRVLAVEILGQHGALLTVRVDGRRLEAGLVRTAAGWLVDLGGRVREVSLVEAGSGPAGPHPRAAAGPARVLAPMPGRIVRVQVAPGDDVRVGQGLMVMEAMKMENEIRAPRDGCVRDVAVRERQAVETGAVLAILDPPRT